MTKIGFGSFCGNIPKCMKSVSCNIPSCPPKKCKNYCKNGKNFCGKSMCSDFKSKCYRKCY